MRKKRPTQSTTQLSKQQRITAAAKSLLCLFAAIAVLLYGLVFATNLSTVLNPVNTTLNVLITVLCYGTVAVLFVLLWHGFNRFMTQAFSGLK
ncbi:hypothetical protein OS175_04140 [Marinicella sp. S1101]|uniref:hypothetical protein n=1 Tax=Marinicella marina TaxID=2996016 RepID=UPI002260A869|nr:hypothetical protein [Marinicella marina]MCX7553057.1 hypothetical protein [Marinicella marina]MDJ1139583.1 hypothetical protein [Marinicella marina]